VRLLMRSILASLERPTEGTSTAKRIVHGISWQLLTAPMSRLFAFLVNILQARLLGKAGYGELGMALSTLTFFSLFATASAGNTCTKFIAELRVTDKARAERICGVSLQAMLILAFVGAVLCYLLAPYIAVVVLRNPALTALLRLCAISLILQTLEGALSGILFGFQSFRAPSIANALQVAAWLPLTYVLIVRSGIVGAMWAFTLSHALCVIALAVATVQELKAEQFRIRWRDAWQESGVLWRYSFPMILHGVLCVPTVWLTNAILARQPNGYLQLGAYNAAFTFRTAVIQVPMIMQGVAMPFLSELSGASDFERFSLLFDRLVRVSWGVGLAAAIAVSLFGRSLMQLFGREFRTDSAIMALVMAVAATSLLSSLTGAALQALGLVWTALWANVFYAAASIALAWYLVPRLSGIGLALSFVLSTFLQAFVLLFLLSNKIHSTRLWTHTLLGGLSSVLISSLALSPASIRVLCVAAAMVALWTAGVPAMVARIRGQFTNAPESAACISPL